MKAFISVFIPNFILAISVCFFFFFPSIELLMHGRNRFYSSVLLCWRGKGEPENCQHFKKSAIVSKADAPTIFCVHADI